MTAAIAIDVMIAIVGTMLRMVPPDHPLKIEDNRAEEIYGAEAVSVDASRCSSINKHAAQKNSGAPLGIQTPRLVRRDDSRSSP